MIASKFIAHRGCAHLAPENTLAAMRLTRQLGIDWVEIDANLMGDGTVVIFHDDNLSRLTSKEGNLQTMSLPDLANIDVGSHFSVDFQDERILTLEEMLAHLASNHMGLNLEIKRYHHFSPEDIVAPTLKILEQNWTEPARLIISSFDHDILTLIADARPDLQLGHLWETLPKDWETRVEAVNAVSVHLEGSLLTPPQAHAVKQAGLDLYVYTVNDAAQADRLFDMGVDGIFTDNPKLFRSDV